MHLVQELASVPANLFRLAGHVLTDDRQEARTGCGKFSIVDLDKYQGDWFQSILPECVLYDKPETDKATGGHNLKKIRLILSWLENNIFLFFSFTPFLTLALFCIKLIKGGSKNSKKRSTWIISFVTSSFVEIVKDEKSYLKLYTFAYKL